ncbi:MAG: acetylornithine/LysW-gamma-L-lysine aminotransferase [Candidatus Promineifilaceae bacterium]|jgi:acetylornithine/LysW-gamma-L-lysine aminotransferase
MNSNQEIIELESKYTSGVYGKREVAIVRGEGAIVWDGDGNELIDCSSGYGVANIGHCHPHVVRAIVEQSTVLLAAAEFVYNDTRARFEEKLVSILPDGLDKVYLCNSGAEANEAAIKFARLSSGKTDFIATVKGFHGRTMGALSATWNKEYKKDFEPLIPGFTHVPYNNLEKMKNAITENTAAIIVEAVQGEGGVRPSADGYLAGLRQLCDDKGVLLIIDEVQTGFGRTGKWFAVEHYGVTPDLLCMGKSIGGGVPMGAVGIGPAIQNLGPGKHGSTFGGNPLICAAALANIEAFLAEGLIEQAAERGAYLIKKLRQIEHPMIREVRGLGLMVGIELKVRVGPILRALQENGVIGMPAGKTVLRLLPPAVISHEQIDFVVNAIEKALADTTEK